MKISHNLGDIFLKDEKYDQAELTYLKAQAMDPTNSWAFIGYARVAQHKQMHTEALKRWKKVKEKFPDKIEAYLGLGNAYSGLSNFLLAEKMFLEAQAMDPTNPWAFIGYARIAQHQRMHTEALKRWATVKEKFPDRIQAYVGLGDAYNGLCEYEQAETMYLKAQAIDTTNPWAFINYARMAQHQQMHSEALKRWGTVREKFPDNNHLYVGLGDSFNYLTKYKDAEIMYLKAQEIAPTNPWAFISYARVAQQQNMHTEALKRWETVKEKFSDNIMAYVGLSDAYTALAKFKQAESMCLKAQLIDPENPYGFSAHQQVLEIKRRRREEKRFLSQARWSALPSGVKLLVCIYTCKRDIKRLKRFYSSHLYKFFKKNSSCKVVEVYADESLSEPVINNDTITINCPEKYSNLSIKTYRMIKLCIDNYEFTHMLKVDSSIMEYNKYALQRHFNKRLSEYNLLRLLTDPNFYIEYNGSLPSASSSTNIENWAAGHDVNINAKKIIDENTIISFFSGKFYLIDKSFANFISERGEFMSKEHEKLLYGVEDIMIGRLYEQFIASKY